MRGGKGVPETVGQHPMVFLTLTAPAFGPVHSRRVLDGEPRRCRPRRKGETCPHGISLACSEIHDEDDPRLGEPICPKCFDYEHQVLWNAMAPELWRRTSNQMPRELARLTDSKQCELDARTSYVKVAEYQRRGALHFHLVLRLDRVTDDGAVEPPENEHGCQLLIDAALAAVRHASVLSPTPEPGDERAPAREIRWGAQVEVRALEPGAAASECAGYIAKYATKSTEAVGGLMHPLSESDVATLRIRPHARRLVETAWRLGSYPHLRELRLRKWAHALGFRGHCFTKSRRYSTTFTALRQARHEYRLRRVHGGELRDPWGRPVSEGASCEQRRWHYTGSGYRTLGDAWLAELGEQELRESRRLAREELGWAKGYRGRLE
jgi:hypothetical protein